MDPKLDKLIRDVESAVGKLRTHSIAMAKQAEGNPSNSPSYRRGGLLASIAKRGGQVSTAKFYELGEAWGYADMRALGGFFNGQNSSLEVVPGSGDRRLTTFGKQVAQNWVGAHGSARVK